MIYSVRKLPVVDGYTPAISTQGPTDPGKVFRDRAVVPPKSCPLCRVEEGSVGAQLQGVDNLGRLLR